MSSTVRRFSSVFPTSRACPERRARRTSPTGSYPPSKAMTLEATRPRRLGGTNWSPPVQLRLPHVASLSRAKGATNLAHRVVPSVEGHDVGSHAAQAVGGNELEPAGFEHVATELVGGRQSGFARILSLLRPGRRMGVGRLSVAQDRAETLSWFVDPELTRRPGRACRSVGHDEVLD